MLAGRGSCAERMEIDPLSDSLPVLLTYLLSFVYLGIY